MPVEMRAFLLLVAQAVQQHPVRLGRTERHMLVEVEINSATGRIMAKPLPVAL